MNPIEGVAVSLDLLDPELHRDPYPIFHALREEGDGIHAGPMPGSWWLTRYDDISRLQRDSATFASISSDMVAVFSSALGVTRDDPRLALARAWDNSMLFKDPPQHRRLRTLVSRAFTPSAISEMRPITEKIAGQLLDGIAPDTEVDLVPAFAVPLPVYVIASMIGFDADDSRLVSWSTAVAQVAEQGIGSSGNAAEAMSLGSELIEHLEEQIAKRRAAPRDDLISRLCSAEEDGDKLSHDELVGMVILLLAAGNITTTHLIANAVALLIDHPRQWERLRADEELVPSTVEEVLRFAPSIQISARRCTTETNIGIRTFAADSQLFTLTGAANRDPRYFTAPDDFDVGRNDRTHLTFALGIHTCLGAALARMEADVALHALLRRFQNLSAGSRPRELRPGFTSRGFDHLPVIAK